MSDEPVQNGTEGMTQMRQTERHEPDMGVPVREGGDGLMVELESVELGDVKVGGRTAVLGAYGYNTLEDKFHRLRRRVSKLRATFLASDDPVEIFESLKLFFGMDKKVRRWRWEKEFPEPVVAAQVGTMSLQDEVRWVAANLHVKGVKLDHAPSVESWGLLKFAEKHELEFRKLYHSKLMPSRERVNAADESDESVAQGGDLAAAALSKLASMEDERRSDD